MRWMTALLVMTMALVVAVPASAQPGPRRGGGPAAGPGGPAHKQQVRLRLLQRRVGLDDATARKVIEVLRAHEGKRAELARKMRAEKRTLGRLVRQDSNDEAAYRQAIDNLMRTQQQLEALRFEEFKELRKVLTAKQQAKLLVELNRLMKRRQRGAGAGGPPPGRGPGGPRGPRPKNNW